MTQTYVRLNRPFAALAAALVALNACASLNNKEKGGIIGATGGAVVGGAIGNANGSTAKGAILGAVIGGAAGMIIGHQMDKQAAELKQNIPGATVTRVGEGIAVVFDSGLMFDFDSAVILAPARSNLDALATSLDKYDNSNLMIVGHTDNVGSETYNLGLSERRAASAAGYLAQRGVERIDTRGRGEYEPLASNDTEAGRHQNRRVEIAIYASEEARAAAKKQAGA